MSESYVVQPIDDATVAALRSTATTEVVADVSPGFPCRACLRDAEVGDVLVLVTHDPFAGSTSPYATTSPIYLHAGGCTDTRDDETPLMLASRRLSVRAYDGDAMLLDATLLAGTDLEAALDRFFADTRVATVHVHNAAPGCWNTNYVRR